MNTARNSGVACATAALATLALLPMLAFADPPPAAANAALVERGRYLVTTSGCHDCHTPLRMGENGPEPDMSRMLSGHPESLVITAHPAHPGEPWMMIAANTLTAFSGPWGMSFTANLTPDEETGLGRWTLQNFKDTIRSGRHMGRGREILPPMPIPMYKNFNDADFEAIYAFLRSIPPVKNRVPEPLPPAVAPTAAP
jgi:mono/diheme cytochrome c family protein